MKNILENEIESYLKKQCNKQGLLFFKFTSPGHNGVPDRIVIGFKKTIFIELKKPGERPRLLQKITIENMRKKGAICTIIDSKKGVDAFLSDIKKGKKYIRTTYYL